MRIDLSLTRTIYGNLNEIDLKEQNVHKKISYSSFYSDLFSLSVFIGQASASWRIETVFLMLLKHRWRDLTWFWTRDKFSSWNAFQCTIFTWNFWIPKIVEEPRELAVLNVARKCNEVEKHPIRAARSENAENKFVVCMSVSFEMLKIAFHFCKSKKKGKERIARVPSMLAFGRVAAIFTKMVLRNVFHIKSLNFSLFFGWTPVRTDARPFGYSEDTR